jgi:hypothetical protein
MQTVSGLQNEKSLHMDGGEVAWIYLIPLNCTLKNG